MKYLTVILALLLTSCAVVKVPVATGGSKADGIVELAYQYGGFEDPQVDWQKANVTAISRCLSWGYNDANSFGGTTSTCAQYDYQYGCMRNQVTIKYQCTNK